MLTVPHILGTLILFSQILFHTMQTVRNKCEKCEHIGKAIFDITFMIQSHAESMKKIIGALRDLQANLLSQTSPIPQIMAEFTVLVSW